MLTSNSDSCKVNITEEHKTGKGYSALNYKTFYNLTENASGNPVIQFKKLPHFLMLKKKILQSDLVFDSKTIKNVSSLQYTKILLKLYCIK